MKALEDAALDARIARDNALADVKYAASQLHAVAQVEPAVAAMEAAYETFLRGYEQAAAAMFLHYGWGSGHPFGGVANSTIRERLVQRLAALKLPTIQDLEQVPRAHSAETAALADRFAEVVRRLQKDADAPLEM